MLGWGKIASTSDVVFTYSALSWYLTISFTSLVVLKDSFLGVYKAPSLLIEASWAYLMAMPLVLLSPILRAFS